MKCFQKIQKILENDVTEEVVCGEETPSLTKNIPTCRKCRERLKLEKDKLFEETKIGAMSYNDLLAASLFVKTTKRELPEKIRKQIGGKLLKKQFKKRFRIDKWGIGIRKLKTLQQLAEELGRIDEQERNSKSQGNNTEVKGSDKSSGEGN